MFDVAVKWDQEAHTLPENVDELLSTAIHSLSSRLVLAVRVVFTGWQPDFVKVGPEAKVLSLAKIPSSCEINNLHSFLKPPICYDCCPWSASSSCGSAYLTAAFVPAEGCSLRIWRFDSN